MLLANSREWPTHNNQNLSGQEQTSTPTSDEKSSNGAASTTLMVSLLLGWTVANPPETTPRVNRWNQTNKKYHSLNHFFDALLDSITSTTPGRKGSIDGTWFANIPMSPEAAEMFTWTTSVEVKIALKWHFNIRLKIMLTTDALDVEEPGKVWFCQTPLHIHALTAQMSTARVEPQMTRGEGQT
jgi:hypothetical protein